MLFSHTIKLVRFKQGVDGLKTGYTKDSGYCLTATMLKDDMRVIAVTMGEPNSNTRNDEVSGMLDYAFAQYAVDLIYSKDQIVDKLKLDKSNMDYVDVVSLEDVKLLYKKVDKKIDYTYEIKYKDIKSEIKKGDIVGNLIIMDKDKKKELKKVPLSVNKDVSKASFIDLFSRYLKDIVVGNINIK